MLRKIYEYKKSLLSKHELLLNNLINDKLIFETLKTMIKNLKEKGV